MGARPEDDTNEKQMKRRVAKKDLHVCMLAYTYYDTDNRVRRYAEALAARGTLVDSFVLRSPGQPRFEIVRGVHVHRIQTRIMNEKSKWFYFLKILTFFLNSVVVLTVNHIRRPYHLVHVHSIPDFLVFATVFLKLFGVKDILDIHDLVPEFFVSKFNREPSGVLYQTLAYIEKLSCKYANYVIIANDLWLKTLRNRCNIGEKSVVFLNYPDPTLFYKRPKGPSDVSFRILFPGTLSHHQGVDIAIRALARIKDELPKCRLDVYGNGTERRALHELTRKLSLENRVGFMDFVQLEQIAEIMAGTDLAVVPKRKDSFGNEAFSTKILEFMALGVPVIASDTYIDRYYFDDSSILFFESGNDEDLARAILRCARDKELREKMAAEGLRVAEKMNWNNHKNRYFALVDDLTGAD